MANPLENIDRRADSAVNKIRGRATDLLFYGLSSAADHSILWHICGIIWAAAMRYPWFALQLSVALGVESAITNGPIKLIFRRVRPPLTSTDPLPLKLRRPITSSFPSGHATSAFTAAFILVQPLNVIATCGVFLVAALVSISRVYVRLHHFSDVAAGIVLGCGFGFVATLFVYP